MTYLLVFIGGMVTGLFISWSIEEQDKLEPLDLENVGKDRRYDW